MKRPIILTFIHHYIPGYKSGGPVRTIANMVDHLGDELYFRIITADRDALDSEPYPDIEINAWNHIGKAKVYYLPPTARKLIKIKSIINEVPFDIIYLNSLFDPVFTLWPLLIHLFDNIPQHPVVIAPRGEFSVGAITLKQYKKAIYLVIARWMRLYDSLIWQASSEYEAEDICRIMKITTESIRVAPNLVMPVKDKMIKQADYNSKERPLRIVFLSRISPKKNLDYALRILAQVSVPVFFDIYGPVGDENYWRKCQKLITNLPSHVSVKYHGAIDHAGVNQVLFNYDLFFLPTRGENYGHVIFEALASGVPVLISDQTPWQNIDEKNIGWSLSLDQPEKFVEAINHMAQLDVSLQLKKRERTLAYASSVAMDSNVINSNLALFKDLI